MSADMARNARSNYGMWNWLECPVCDGTGVAEEPVFGRFAAEASRPTPCPKCCRELYDADQARYQRRLSLAARDRRGAA